MTSNAPTRKSPWPDLISGGFILATVDLVFVFAFWKLSHDVSPVRILQSIAAGLQGPAAFQGGAASAVLGTVCHYFIATMMVLAYYLVSTRWHALVRLPVRYGLAYGALLYVVMTYVVVPLSNAPQNAKTYLPWVLSSIVMHVVFGVICAWYACKARRTQAGMALPREAGLAIPQNQ